MRALTGTLLSAQRSSSREPCVRCIVDDQPPEMPRFSWSQLYAGAEDDFPNDAAICADGSIVRARVVYDYFGSFHIYIQRVIDPLDSAQWSNWTQLRAYVSPQCVAVKADDAGATVMVFYVHLDGRRLLCRRSSDFGATWAQEETVWEFQIGEIRAVAADGRCSDNHVVFSFDPGGVDPDDYLLVSRHVGASWEGPWVDMGQRYSQINSLAVARGADDTLQIVVCSGPSGQLGARQYDLSTNSFTGSYELLTPGAGSGYSYGHPKALGPSNSIPRWFFTYYEDFSGISKHVWLACTGDGNWLGEAVPLNVDTAHGVKLLRDDDHWYLIGVRSAYRSPVYLGGNGDRIDVSSRVRALEVVEREVSRAADGGCHLAVKLDNSDGQLANAGQEGPNKPLRQGSRIALGLGYVTVAGQELVWSTPWWVDSIVFDDQKGEGTVELTCIDAWEYLARLPITRQNTFEDTILHYVLRRALWPICDIGTVAAHPNLEMTVPVFTWQPGESYAEVARRVLQMAGLGLRFRTVGVDGFGWNSVGTEVYELGAGSSTYGYGPDGHSVVHGRYGVATQRFNEVSVAGLSHQVAVFDWQDISVSSRVFVRRVFEKHLDTVEKCLNRAQYALLETAMAKNIGLIETWANVGQEVGDVVEVTDLRAGLNGALRRVSAISTVYDNRKGRFDQRIELTGV